MAKGGQKIKKDEAPVASFGGAPQHGFLVRNATMAEFTTFLLLAFMDLPVVDQTGFGGTRCSLACTYRGPKPRWM